MSRYPQIDQPHVCTPETCPQPGKYFVSAVDAGKYYMMAGPYPTHSEALQNRDAALKIANKHDASGRAWFMGWGTCRTPDDYAGVGILNSRGLIQ
jgi:hypothetical protein